MNEKQVNAIYLQTLLQSKTEIEPEQLTTLWSIAGQCPDDGGEAVYRARALLAFFDPSASYDDMVLCDLSSPELRNSAKHSDFSTMHVHPNPTKDVLTVELGLAQSESGQLEVSNIIGRVLLSKKVDAKIQEVNFDISSLKDGLYVVRLKNGKSIIEVRKFVVVR